MRLTKSANQLSRVMERARRPPPPQCERYVRPTATTPPSTVRKGEREFIKVLKCSERGRREDGTRQTLFVWRGEERVARVAVFGRARRGRAKKKGERERAYSLQFRGGVT